MTNVEMKFSGRCQLSGVIPVPIYNEYRKYGVGINDGLKIFDKRTAHE